MPLLATAPHVASTIFEVVVVDVPETVVDVVMTKMPESVLKESSDWVTAYSPVSYFW